MNADQQLARAELDDLLAIEEGLTDWEVEFIESLNAGRDRGPFTERQLIKFRQIHDRLCWRGGLTRGGWNVGPLGIYGGNSECIVNRCLEDRDA